MRVGFLAVLLLGCVATGACGDSVETVTGPSEIGPTVGYFSGLLEKGGVRFYSFTVTNAGTASVMLASVLSTTSQPLDTPLTLGIGIPRGIGCAVSDRMLAAPALVSQLTQTVEAGVHCVEVRDDGALTAAVRFTARFAYP